MLMRASSLVSSFAAGVGLLAALETHPAREALPPPPLAPESSTQVPREATPPSQNDCSNCAVIASIRQVEAERPPREMPTYIGSQEYQSSRDFSPPAVGPVFGLTFGPGGAGKPFVGAAGSPEMQKRLLTTVYEVTVYFDDGRAGLLEVPDIGALRVGDRVRVEGQHLEALVKPAKPEEAPAKQEGYSQ